MKANYPTPIRQTKLKAINWSYPTSPNAIRFGFASTGCYTVSIIRGNTPPVAQAGFRTLKQAQDFAANLHCPYARFQSL